MNFRLSEEQETLRSIAEQEFSAFQVLISVDNADDETAPALKRQPDVALPVAACRHGDDQRRAASQTELGIPLPVGPVGQPPGPDDGAPDAPARVAVDDGDDHLEPLGLGLREGGRRDERPLLGRV